MGGASPSAPAPLAHAQAPVAPMAPVGPLSDTALAHLPTHTAAPNLDETECPICVELLEPGETYEASDLRFCKRQQLYYSFDVGTLHAHEDRDACAASPVCPG